MSNLKTITPLIESLVGEKSQFMPDKSNEFKVFENGEGLGYSQFNEILLLMGFDRVWPEFFQFLVDRTTHYKPGT